MNKLVITIYTVNSLSVAILYRYALFAKRIMMDFDSEAVCMESNKGSMVSG